jgi:tetratricopeptide (TPR) repeat protein
MAESPIFEGILGEDAETGGVDGGAAGADPFAAAMAVNAAERGEGLDPRAAAYLEEQTRLVRLQIRHFDQEHRLGIEAARRKRFSDRLRNGLQLFIAIVAAAITIGLLGMAWAASQDHGLVVEAFSVPPDLATQGLNGQVVAKQVLDRLTDLQAQTKSMRPADSYQNNWGEDLKVEIPETGVSLGDIRQYLHVWLGHETHISGEIFHTAQGLTVTARAGEDGAKSVSGPAANLDTLIQQAAEAVYERTQPYRYAVYLRDHNRVDEAKVVLAKLLNNPDPVERAWAHIGIANISPNTQGVEELRAALRDVPNFLPALWNLFNDESSLQHDEASLRASRDFLAAQDAKKSEMTPLYRQEAVLEAQINHDEALGDFVDSARLSQRLLLLPNAMNASGKQNLAGSLIADHDEAGARSALTAFDPADPGLNAGLGLLAQEEGRPADAVARWTSLSAWALAQGVPGEVANLRQIAPYLALVKARSGDRAAAQATIAPTPMDCYICLRHRGLIAALAGDKAGADRWFAQAVSQAPDLPQAYIDRGQAHLDWGDVAGAIRDAVAAARLGPHDPDAFKLWGDGWSGRGAGGRRPASTTTP